MGKLAAGFDVEPVFVKDLSGFLFLGEIQGPSLMGRENRQGGPYDRGLDPEHLPRSDDRVSPEQGVKVRVARIEKSFRGSQVCDVLL